MPAINTGSSLGLPLTVAESKALSIYATHFDFPVKFPFSPSPDKSLLQISSFYFLFRPFISAVPSHEMLSQWLWRYHSMTFDSTLSAGVRTLFTSVRSTKRSILFHFSNPAKYAKQPSNQQNVSEFEFCGDISRFIIHVIDIYGIVVHLVHA